MSPSTESRPNSSSLSRASAMSRGGRKKRRKFCLPSCFSGPSAWDPDELEFQEDGLPTTYLSRFRSRSRTVPVAEIAGDGGDGYVKFPGERQSEDSPALLSPAGNQDKGLLQKSRKEKRKMKETVQSLAHTPRPARIHTVQSVFRHVPTKLNSRTHHLAQLNQARDPVQTVFRTSHPSTPQPKRTAGPTRSAHRLDAVTGLLMISATLAIMLFFGRLYAVFCNCALFYLQSQPPSPPEAAATVIDWAEEVDVYSPEYKKKVVLMGLLERNRYGVSGLPVTSVASPSAARLRIWIQY